MMKNRFPAVLAIGLLIIVCQTDYSRAQDYTAPQVTVSKEKTASFFGTS